jgi:hypothetical protein
LSLIAHPPDAIFGDTLDLRERPRAHKSETLKLLVMLADATLHRPDKLRALWALTALQQHVLATMP